MQKAIQDSKAIRELAGNPLLLTLMAILNRNQELPRDRPELYNQASRLLLHQWDIERNLIEHRLDPYALDYRDKQAILRRVAYHMQSSEKGLAGNIISAQELEQCLSNYLRSIEVDQPRVVAKLLIEQLRQRNFILCYFGAESYAFVHRTFLEYFCASTFVWEFKESQTMSFDQLRDEVFGAHWRDDAWEVLLRLISGMIEPRFVGKLMAFLLDQKVNLAEHITERNYLKPDGLRNVLLAAGCLSEVRNRTSIMTVANRLWAILTKLAETQYPYLLDEKTAEALLNAVVTNWLEEVKTPSWLKACVVLRSEFQEYVPTYYQILSSRSFIPAIAVQSITQNWKDDPDTLQYCSVKPKTR